MSSLFVQANTNGRLHSADEPSLSPLDRGFLYGDAIYEVWRTYDGTLFTFAEHWARLEASARALDFTLPFNATIFLNQIRRTITAYRAHTNDQGEVYVRLQISRGGGRIGLDPALADFPNWVLLVQSLPRISPEKLRTGLHVRLARQIRRNHPLTLNPLWKSGNYLNNVMALHEARRAGADEALMINLDGEITEGTTLSIAFVRDGAVYTPHLSSGLLASVTRRFFIDHVAPRAGVTVHERALRESDLPSMQEAFFLSSTKDITPIGRIDDQSFASGESTLTWKLKRTFADAVRDYAAKHPELKI